MTSHKTSRQNIVDRLELVIQGGTVVEETGVRVADVGVSQGRVVVIAPSLGEIVELDEGCDVLDATDCFIASGFVDLHSHLREPGREDAETIRSGATAAARGGYTAVIAMPNTNPAQDVPAVVDFVRSRGEEAAKCDVYPAGCITIGRQGTELVDFVALAERGVRIFTDDGAGVQDDSLMKRALETAHDLDIVLAQHCEVTNLTEGAVMNEGRCCSLLGVPGWPARAEEEMLRRDIELVRLTGSPMHFLHLSTRGSVELVRRAKQDGLPVTAEVTPHHLALTEDNLMTFDPVFKVNPPLRTIDDVDALRRGLLDGTIDAVATDHAPHPSWDKDLPLDQAPPGMLGLETAFAVVNTVLELPVQRLVEVMSWTPARIAGLERHGSRQLDGQPANLVVFDLDERWRVDRTTLASLSSNTPFDGSDLRGRVRWTLLDGRIVHESSGIGTR